MKLFGKSKEKVEEQSELRSQIKPKRKPKKDPIEIVKQRQRELTERLHQDYKPQEYGLKLWWVLGFDKKGEDKYDGPHFSYGEADRKLRTYDDGEIFELRNITTKRDAEKEIKRILKERQEEETEFLQGRLSAIETPRRTSHEVTEPKSPNGRFHLPFSRNGKGPD